MHPSYTLDRVRTTGGRELVLYERDGVITIRCDGLELMSSRAHGSEEELAALALDHLGPDRARRPAPRALVGGLGLGFTLRALLDRVDQRWQVVVAEVFPEVVRWNRRWVGHLAGHPLQDPRVDLRTADLRRVLEEDGGSSYDLVLLDVDNGPEAFTLGSNRWLYERSGLRAIRRAVREGGVVGLWSSFRATPFEGLLRDEGWQVRSKGSRPRPGARISHWLYVARKRR